MEIFLNIAISLETILKSKLRRIDIHLIEDDWYCYVYYANNRSFLIEKEGAIFIEKEGAIFEL